MPQLDPTWYASQIFWLILTFCGLYVVLSKVCLPPLIAMLEKRNDAIAGNLARAQQMKTQADTAREEYEMGLAVARADAQKVLGGAQDEAKLEASRAQVAMDKAVTAKVSEAERRIARAKEELMQKLAPASSELTSLIVEKLVHYRPDAQKVSSALDALTRDKNVRR
jgi:F-type H+-transporting ATPase subunit b